jgi:ATP-dependent helicase Lhr and Lhr-like helicase
MPASTKRLEAEGGVLGLSREVARAFYGTRSTLRPAQEQAILPILRGDDVVIEAGTGSGKTEAALAPLVSRYRSAARLCDGLTLLYVAPTKALLNDLHVRLEEPLRRLGLTVGRRHGDADDLARVVSPDLLLITPESLDNVLVAKTPALLSVQAVVVDELHQFTSSQRGLQLAHLLQRLELHVGHPLQVVAMSATLPPSARECAWTRLRPGRLYTHIIDETVREREFVVRVETKVADHAATLAQTEAAGKVLAFTRSRAGADLVAGRVQSTGAFGSRVFVHHAGLDDIERLRVEREMRQPFGAFCVATGTLELGVDIGDVELTVLDGPPHNWQSFGQRIGRSNRRGNRTNVLALVPPSSRQPFIDACYFLGLIAQTQGRLARSAPIPRLHGALAQQVCSTVRQRDTWISRDDICRQLVMEPIASVSDVNEVIDKLVDDDLLQMHLHRDAVGESAGLHEAERQRWVWGNFPVDSMSLTLTSNGRRLGDVPDILPNRQLLQPGRRLRFANRVWRVKLYPRNRRVVLDRAKGSDVSGELRSGSNGPSIDPVLVASIPDVLADLSFRDYLAASTRRWFDQLAVRVEPLTDKQLVPATITSNGFVYLTFAGRWVNEVLLAWTESPGHATETSVTTERPVDFTRLPQIQDMGKYIAETATEPSGLTQWQQLLPIRLLADEQVSVWEQDPYYRDALSRLREGKQWQVSTEDLAALLTVDGRLP